MFDQRATLPLMDPDLERLMAYVADVVLEQGGDWEATFAILRRELSGTEAIIEDDDLAKGMVLAVGALVAYTEPRHGIALLTGLRDRGRRLVPVAPVRRGWWRSTG
jgi:pyrimidine operon attenuation protein/uracil phosphoribosyltransferase